MKLVFFIFAVACLISALPFALVAIAVGCPAMRYIKRRTAKPRVSRDDLTAELRRLACRDGTQRAEWCMTNERVANWRNQ